MRREILFVTLASAGVLLWRFMFVARSVTSGSLDQRVAALALIMCLVTGLWWLTRRSTRGTTVSSDVGHVTGIARWSFTVLVALGWFTLVAPVLPFRDPTLFYTQPSAPPSWMYPLGTDHLGRDLLTRMVHGMRYSFAVGVVSISIAVSVGAVIGLIAGYVKRADAILMRIVDAGMAIPRIFLLLMIFTFWGRVNVLTMIVILGLTSWFPTSRMVRNEALSQISRDYILAAQSSGYGVMRILWKHVLPNVATPIIVTATLGAGYMILVESGLAFLGVGLRPPNPSLGSILNDAWQQSFEPIWMAVEPGVVISLMVIAFSFLGDGLRDALDPHHR